LHDNNQATCNNAVPGGSQLKSLRKLDRQQDISDSRMVCDNPCTKYSGSQLKSMLDVQRNSYERIEQLIPSIKSLGFAARARAAKPRERLVCSMF